MKNSTKFFILFLLILLAVLVIITGKRILLVYHSPSIKKQVDIVMQTRTVCLDLKISLPDGWKIEEIKSRMTPEPLEGITYEASINKNSFKLLNANNQKQLNINCFQPMKMDETGRQIKQRLSLEEAVEVLKPTEELSDFKSINFNFDISTVDQKQCAYLVQWILPEVRCNPPGSKCGPAPKGIKNEEIFICTKDGNKGTGAFIYEIIKYYQFDRAGDDNLLNKVFNSITF